MKQFEIINHGIENSDYFQGCGTAFTPFKHCVTGIGMTTQEAYEDAIEQVYMSDDNADKYGFPEKHGTGVKYTVGNSDNDRYCHVSIRYGMED